MLLGIVKGAAPVARVSILAIAFLGLWLVALLSAPASAGFVVGPLDGSFNFGDSLTASYYVSSPTLILGSPGSGMPLSYNGGALPVLKIIQVNGSAYHHLHLTEHWTISGSEYAYDWNELLVVPNGSGGWMPSGNYDDLWFSAKASVTPQPVVAPTPDAVVLTNKPWDLLVVDWVAGLPVGTQVTVDLWITVPSGMTTFGIYQFQQLTTGGIPEPATMGLLGAGLGLLLTSRRRRRLP